MAYLGHEGYALGSEFRAGKQTPEFLGTCIERAQRIIPDTSLLVRLDSGHDSRDNIDICRDHHTDFLMKRNLRREQPEEWLALAQAESAAERPREGQVVYRGATKRAPQAGQAPERIIDEVLERTIAADGQ